MTSAFDFSAKRVIVTGAASGVGAALLDVLAEQNAEHVTVVDIKTPTGPHHKFVEANLGSKAGVEAVIAACDGRVDALFNNAGVADTQPPNTVFSVNFLALRALSTGLVDQMPQGAAIVNTASTAGGQWADRAEKINALIDITDWDEAVAWYEKEAAELNQAPYFFSKECVQLYTMRSSRPTIKRGIRTNSVCPSPIDTPLIVDFRATMTDKMIDWNISETNGRMVSAREVATVLAFLGSDAAAYVNGVNLNVDAGFNAAMTTGQVDFSALFA